MLDGAVCHVRWSAAVMLDGCCCHVRWSAAVMLDGAAPVMLEVLPACCDIGALVTFAVNA